MWILKGFLTLCVFNLVSTGRVLDIPQLDPLFDNFAVRLLKALIGDDEPSNLIVSPVGVAEVLCLLLEGAKNETNRQLANALDLFQSGTSHGDHQLSNEAHGNSTNTTAVMEINNGLFLAQRFELKPEYCEDIRRFSNASVEKVTFGDGEGAAAINAWVANVTHGRIHELVEPSFSSDTALVLVDITFFNHSWKYVFNTDATTPQIFYVRPGKEVTVAMMHTHSDVITSGSNDELRVQWVQLPFADERFYMIIIVPYDMYGLAAFLRNFTGNTLNVLLDNPNPPEFSQVKLHMPRFTLFSEPNLIPALQKLGITDLFNASASDLSGITTSPEPLFVSEVIQKAGIHVNEDGVFAVAGSEAEVLGNLLGLYDVAFEVTADHPFLAVLVDNELMRPLFFSPVVDPSALM